MFEIYTLDNGLRVVTEYIEHVNSVSVGVMVQNGSRNEENSVNGISHFIEHMFFKGTNKRSAKEIVQHIENVGGQINAYTSKETTCYYTKSLYTHLNLCLDVLSDMILNAKFDDEEIEKEKGVVIEEINMSEDNPEDVLEDIHSKVIFGDNPLADPILGTIDIIKSLNSSKIKEYVKKHYTPHNSVISICGKFDKNELKKLMENYFGSWDKNEIYIPTYKEVNLLGGANNIFGGGASSVLFQKVREELGLCYTIYSYSQPYIGVGSLNIYTGLSKQFANKALEVISRELKLFADKGISDEKLKINKEKLISGYLLGLESTASRMFANAKCLLLQNKIKTAEEVTEKINKINKQDINYVLEECFKPGIISASYVGQDVEIDGLNKIVGLSDVAYNRDLIVNDKRV